MRKIIFLFAILFVLALFNNALAATIYVPADYTSIQAALNACNTGDEIIVSDSTYTENITWPAVDSITLRSENGAETTIIDGGSNGSVITINDSIINSATIIDGFTIQNGDAVEGAGIYIKDASPTIQNYIIIDNEADNYYASGAGIYIKGSSGNTVTPIIQNNTITQNNCTGVNITPPNGKAGGSGIAIHGYSYPTIKNNMITDNTSIYGGGIYCNGGQYSTINNNIIANNVASCGGGIACNFNATLLIENNIIMGNSSSYDGGAIYSFNYNASSPIYIRNNTIINNSATNDSNGGGIYKSNDNSIPILGGNANYTNNIYHNYDNSGLNDLYNNGTNQIDATYNYWGTGLTGNVYGNVDTV